MKSESIYIHIPAHLLPGRINFLLNRQLQPEVACQEISLDKLDFNHLGECADQLLEQGLTTTLHAPYSGFHPGSNKKRLRKRAYALAEKSLQLAQKLRARRVVFHPGLAFNSTAEDIALWLDQNRTFWLEFIEQAREIDTVICLENIYESTPHIFVELLNSIDSPQLGHVFDIGHWNMFGTTGLLDWMDSLAPYLRHFHLHDNHGERDEHLAVGHGDIPFSAVFDWLKKQQQQPTITLENRNLPNTELSLLALQRVFPELHY